MSLQEIDEVTITVLMDNSTDLLLTNSEQAMRMPLILKERINLPPPIAEHGFSALVNVVKYDRNKNPNLLLIVQLRRCPRRYRSNLGLLPLMNKLTLTY
jgi:7,8-dihydropterin-6-yl-methyl-4-(beta-D-ribofuranosyl)aminobenzene 5'-phosphate synthase